ncbi:MAG: hypothetical protein ACYS1A_05090 [Planctomycetota bacterium]|jgi:FtsH-binding integral membrane protein
MNKAQKRTWWTFAISAATLLISASVLWYVWVNQIVIIDLEKPMRTRLIGLTNTIPLILILFISTRFRKKDYDERDTIIEHKSSGVGYITAFIFLVVVGYCSFLINPRGSTRNIYWVTRGLYLVYLTFFVSLLTSSIAALIQYGWAGKGEKS